jgi:hypothetical protein
MRRHTTAKIRRKRANSHKKQRGGARIGEGRTSTVFSPPLKCTEHTDKYDSPAWVSKLTTRATAESELRNTAALRAIDPKSQFTLIPVHICPLAREQTNENFGESNTRKGERNTLVIMPNGGIQLGALFTLLESAAYTPSGESTAPPPEYIHAVLIALKELALFIVSMNAAGVYHNDIHFENILYNQDTNEARLIDFELGGKIKHNDLYDIMSVIEQIYIFQNMIYKIETPAFSKQKISRGDYTIEMFRKDIDLIK